MLSGVCQRKSSGHIGSLDGREGTPRAGHINAGDHGMVTYEFHHLGSKFLAGD